MNALSGSLKDRAEKSLEAGCDIVLQSRGTVQEMEAVMDVVPFITEAQDKILEEAFGHGMEDHKVNRIKLRTKLNDLFSKYKLKGLDQNNLVDPTV